MAKDDKKQIDKQSSVKKSPSSSKGAGANNEQVDVPQPQANITFSGGIGGFLSNNAISLAFTSYQTGRLYLLGNGIDGKMAIHEAQYPQAMGITGDANRLYLGTLTQLVRMENVLQIGQIANNKHDKVYVPRNFQTTGGVDIHELGICGDGKVVFINTKYSCLAELSLTHSFKPIWKPAFISKLAPEDRCHLNGLAMVDGRPKYASAICKSDVVDGWRDRRHDGGIIIDIETDKIVAEGLSMPHSPRWHDGKLWIVNSGTGELGTINLKTKKFEPMAFCPGFLRGLAFHNGHAFVTLSKPRYGRFEGLSLDDKLKAKDADAWCGVQIIDLNNGNVAQWVRFDGAIAELFDICVLPDVKDAITLGPASNEIREFITIETPAWLNGKTG